MNSSCEIEKIENRKTLLTHIEAFFSQKYALFSNHCRDTLAGGEEEVTKEDNNRSVAALTLVSRAAGKLYVKAGCVQSRLKLLRVCKQNPIFACLPIHDMSLIFTAAALLSASGASSASNINLLFPTVSQREIGSATQLS